MITNNLNFSLWTEENLLKMIAALTGGVVIGGEVFLTGCKTGTKAEAGFSPSNIALLDEVGETIIPATTTPGAKAAQVGEFMKVMVTDCYTERQQTSIYQGNCRPGRSL